MKNMSQNYTATNDRVNNDERFPMRCSVPARFSGTVIGRTMVLTVAPDRLPCLASSDPDWKQPTFSWAASTDRNFTITSVDDDLVDQNDQVPLTGSGQRIHFTWYEGPASGPLLIQGDDYPTFRRVANPLQAGETRRVRVEIRDDNVDEINRRLFNCGDADQCGNGTDCVFRATWTVKYNL